jgi:pentatricopeptide repeat protein
MYINVRTYILNTCNAQYNAIMAACVKGSKIEEALKLFSYMTDPPLPNESENKNENENPLTNKTSPSNSQDSSSPVQNNPYARFKVPLVRDAYSFGTALHALGKQGSWAKSLALLNFLHEKTPLERTTVMVSTVSTVRCSVM